MTSRRFPVTLAHMKKIISTNEAPAAIGPYSQAVRCGRFLFCSGQIPLNPESGQVVTGDIATQTTYGSYFKQDPPARSTVQVSALPKGANVEIEVIAVSDDTEQTAYDTSG